ncbi:unnamed protein product [Colias eurytheme]|nr:unnamed protein product [Colias eurytheme]
MCIKGKHNSRAYIKFNELHSRHTNAKASKILKGIEGKCSDIGADADDDKWCPYRDPNHLVTRRKHGSMVIDDQTLALVPTGGDAS